MLSSLPLSNWSAVVQSAALRYHAESMFCWCGGWIAKQLGSEVQYLDIESQNCLPTCIQQRATHRTRKAVCAEQWYGLSGPFTLNTQGPCSCTLLPRCPACACTADTAARKVLWPKQPFMLNTMLTTPTTSYACCLDLND